MMNIQPSQCSVREGSRDLSYRGTGVPLGQRGPVVVPGAFVVCGNLASLSLVSGPVGPAD